VIGQCESRCSGGQSVSTDTLSGTGGAVAVSSLISGAGRAARPWRSRSSIAVNYRQRKHRPLQCVRVNVGPLRRRGPFDGMSCDFACGWTSPFPGGECSREVPTGQSF
jgi:hypothetical protein